MASCKVSVNLLGVFAIGIVCLGLEGHDGASADSGNDTALAGEECALPPSVFGTVAVPMSDVYFSPAVEGCVGPSSATGQTHFVDLDGDGSSEVMSLLSGVYRVHRVSDGQWELWSSLPLQLLGYDVPDPGVPYDTIVLGVVTFSDVTADGLPDLLGILRFRQGGTQVAMVYVYLENMLPSRQACDSDLDASGAVDFADILKVIRDWGPCP